MKMFILLIAAVVGTGSVAKADLACVDGLKVSIQGQAVEVAERMNDAGRLVRDSIINGVRSDSNVFLQAKGSNIVVEVRLNQDQAPANQTVDHHTEMRYLIELDAATNSVVGVEFSRNQEIDYGNPIPVSTEMSFETISAPACNYFD